MENQQNNTVYEIPNSKQIDGLNLNMHFFNAVSTRQLDDVRLSKEDDTLVITYPRTGTTWLSQIVSLLIAGEENYDAAKKIPLDERVAFLEYTRLGDETPRIEKLPSIPVPRVSKTHLPFRFISRWITEDNVKTILTTRNPKDTLVSIYHFYKAVASYKFQGTWNDFFEHFQAGKVLSGDPLDWLMDWEKNKDKGDVLVVKYEDMVADITAQITVIAKFLNIKITENLLKRILEDVSLTRMKADSATNNKRITNPGTEFIRAGKVGAWKNTFTVNQNKWFDEKYKQGYMDCKLGVHYE